MQEIGKTDWRPVSPQFKGEGEEEYDEETLKIIGPVGNYTDETMAKKHLKKAEKGYSSKGIATSWYSIDRA